MTTITTSHESEPLFLLARLTDHTAGRTMALTPRFPESYRDGRQEDTMPLRIDGPWFLDDAGRALLLRGVNLGGSSKLPVGCHPREAANPAGAREVSFVGRPFPLEEADEHLGRLRYWGFNVLRLLTCWEAIEHAGPGRYDEAYLDYFAAIAHKAGQFGFSLFIDPHQDAWSRFSGGDGAPAWTLELAGFHLETLDASEAAITLRGRYPHYGTMVWPNNWYRLASATMFTLFFAGDRFAPQLKINGEGIQGYLQRHFLSAMQQLAARLRSLPNVIGYDSLNEPTAGFIGLKRLSTPLPVYNSAPELTGLDALAIPAGFTKEVPFLERQHLTQVRTGTVRLNPGRVSAWQSQEHDVWRRHGVWDVDGEGVPRLLRDDYFANMAFFAEGVAPFARRYAEAIARVHPGAMVFIEGEPASNEPLRWDSDLPVVNASHWYDLLTLTTRHYDPGAALVWGSSQTVEGEAAVRQSFADQIGALVQVSRRDLRGAPTLIGEFGLPFDLDEGAAFRTGDFSTHIQALSAYYDALDTHLAHSTLWNYTADNRNTWGDQWNQENLSIFSRDQQTNPADPNSGGRAIRGFCRPTVRACAGRPIRQQFDFRSRTFRLEIEAIALEVPTLVYVPRCQYPQGIKTTVSSGQASYDPDQQLLSWSRAERGLQSLTLEADASGHPTSEQ